MRFFFRFLFFFLLFLTDDHAKEMARPLSSAHNRLMEVTAGEVWTPHDNFFELGVDFEYFPELFSHHLSLGFASEIEFEKKNEFYFGPLVSFYHSHFKIFSTAGIQGHDNFWRFKSRVGLGYEFFLKDHFIFVPGLCADFIDQETHYAINLGLAKEF